MNNENKTQGKLVLLAIDPTGGTDYDTIVCLTSNSFSSDTNVIDGNSKCGSDQSPGTQSETIDFEGQQYINPDAGTVSAADLYTLKKNQTTFGWKIFEEPSRAGSITKEGQGFLSSYSEDAGVDDYATFSGTITIKGLATQTIETS